MANDRLFIRDKKTGNYFMLAKFHGWEYSNYCEGLEDWLEDQQLEENGASSDHVHMEIKHNYEIVNESELMERENEN